MSSEEETTNEEQQSAETQTQADSLLGEAPSESEAQQAAQDSLLGDGEPKEGGEDDDGEEAPAFDLTPVEAEKIGDLVPEGFQADDEALKDFAELVNKAESREDIVKGSLELLAQHQAKSEEALVEAWNEAQNAWREEVKRDPEIGGEKLEASLAKARTVIETYSPDAKALKELFAVSGAGNSIHMVRFLNAIADALPGEATPVEGTSQPVTKSQADKLFG